MQVNIPGIRGVDDPTQVRSVLYVAGELVHAPSDALGAQPIDATLTALSALDSSAGLVTQTAADTFTKRTLTGTAAEITVTNGDGAAGTPTLSLPAALTFTGKTVTNGTFNAVAFNGPLGGGTPAAVAATTVAASGLISANGGQIAFPASQNASANANTLDDYEEGTFTPTITGTSAAGVGTYGLQSGRYTKIGDVVYFRIAIAWSAHTGTGNMVISGLPFTAAGVAGMPVNFYIDGLTFSNTLMAYVTASATTVSLVTVATGASPVALPIDAVATIIINGSYFV